MGVFILMDVLVIIDKGIKKSHDGQILMHVAVWADHDTMIPWPDTKLWLQMTSPVQEGSILIPDIFSFTQ